MYKDAYNSKNVTERREFLGALSSRNPSSERDIRIDSVEEYEKMPEVKPLNGTEISFYEDGIEAVVSRNDASVNQMRFDAVLIDEKRKQVIKFHYHERENKWMPKIL